MRLTVRAAQRRSPRHRREAIRKAAIPGHGSASSVPRPPANYSYHAAPSYSASGAYGAGRSGSYGGSSRGYSPARAITRDAATVARRRATPPDAAMGHLRRTLRATTARPRPMADGARDRTPHRTLQAVATTVVAAVAATTGRRWRWSRRRRWWTPIVSSESDSHSGGLARAASFCQPSANEDSD